MIEYLYHEGKEIGTLPNQSKVRWKGLRENTPY